MSETTDCPDCSGRGFNVYLTCPGGKIKQETCEGCDGTGSVSASDPRIGWKEEGWRRHHDRVQRNVRLHDEAERLGVSIVTLSKAECGSIDPREVWP